MITNDARTYRAAGWFVAAGWVIAWGQRAGNLAGDIYLEERTDATRYTIAFDRLVAAALHPDDSVRLVGQAADALT